MPMADRIVSMKRWHEERHIMRRQYREGLSLGIVRGPDYYRKRDAHDCGNPRCGLCHREKRFGHQPTRQKQVATLRQIEQFSV